MANNRFNAIVYIAALVGIDQEPMSATVDGQVNGKIRHITFRDYLPLLLCLF